MRENVAVRARSLPHLLLLAVAALVVCSAEASAEDRKRVTWQGIESFEEAYTFSGRISAHLGNVNEYFHTITVRFTYIEETDADGTMRWVSRKIDWDAKGKALARDFTVTICEGSGTIDLGPAGEGNANYVTVAQSRQFTIPCETTDFGILMGPFQKPPDRIEAPGIVGRESLRNGCSYNEWRPGYRYSVWVTPGCQCDPTLYQDYLRKREVSHDLFLHSQDLRRQRDAQVESFLRDALGGGPVEYAEGQVKGKVKGKAEDAAMDYAIKKGKDSQVALRRRLAEQAAKHRPLAGVVRRVGGNLATAAELSYKGYDRARRWNNWDDESREAADRSADLRNKALEDFMADRAQGQACREELRKARAEEERLDHAKELIEEWENNQYLYRDPIRQEALTHKAAIQRALEYLAAPASQQSGFSISLFNVAFADTAEEDSVTVTAEQLEAAIRELNVAIASYERLMELLVKSLDAQEAIEAELDAVMLAPPGIFGTAHGEPIA